ncbi:hypothetical protein H4R18_001222 [Coemansia javaensis]|uniref:Protein yippee-like n=1 Tax=Coemansia javaensis TaxID=2761396 RepID=A0A9W8HM52_9FUNG|nr:hypothetical protein H4R18_001222 [Coemansia javaensis]
MGLVFQQFLEAPAVYVCSSCRAHLARASDVVSRGFQGRLGRAYLVEAVVNERLGGSEDRVLMTGLHTVCDLYCRRCDEMVGWKYIRAHDRAQQYKEGRYVLEQSQLLVVEQQTASPPNIDRVLARFMGDIGIRPDSPATAASQ